MSDTARGGVLPWRSFVAVGDSFTEGLNDPHPDRPGAFRGWADVLAGHLSRRRTAHGEPALQYANLAVRGKVLGQVLSEQLPRAHALSPDLVSLVGGGNDILRPGADIDALLARLEAAVSGLREAGIDVLMGTGVDPQHAPVVRATRPKVGIYNAGIWSIAQRQNAYVVDLWGSASIKDWRMWAEDRIHLNADGHGQVAQAGLVALGLAPDSPDWDEPLPPMAPVGRRSALQSNARWARAHLAPWVGRRLRGRSSGDDITAKIPGLEEVPPALAADHDVTGDVDPR